MRGDRQLTAADGFAMSSNYNMRPRVAEYWVRTEDEASVPPLGVRVAVQGANVDLIRRGETFDDLTRTMRPLA